MKRKRHRRKKPKFTKYYKYTKQDEFFIRKMKLLQKIYAKIAERVSGFLPEKVLGDWTISMEGLTIFIDPVNGNQAEIFGTSKMPLLKRLKIHIRLLKLLKKGYGILKAVEYCLRTSVTQ